MKNKRGIQLNQAFGAVLAVVLVAVIVIIAIFIFSTLQTSFPRVTTTTYNETGRINSSNIYALSNVTLCNAANPILLTVSNGTVLVENTHYTFESENWTISNVTNLTVSDGTWNAVNITYTAQWGGPVCTSSGETITQFATYPALIGLVGTIVFLGIIIGVLIGSFLFSRKNGL